MEVKDYFKQFYFLWYFLGFSYLFWIVSAFINNFISYQYEFYETEITSLSITKTLLDLVFSFFTWFCFLMVLGSIIYLFASPKGFLHKVFGFK